jgi:hypothetical protein
MRWCLRAAAGLAALLLAALTGTAPAAAAAVFVELNPSTVPVGDRVGVRAGCDDNLAPAQVTSDAFGTVTVNPRHGFLTATVTVKADLRPDDYRVRLVCPGGESARATLHVVAKDRPVRGPATGFGGTAGPDPGAVALIAAGLTAIGAGVALGVWRLRRKAAWR